MATRRTIYAALLVIIGLGLVGCSARQATEVPSADNSSSQTPQTPQAQSLPQWAVGTWIGHGRTLQVDSDSTAQLESWDSNELEYGLTLQVTSVSGSRDSGTIETEILSVEKAPVAFSAPATVGDAVSFTINNGVAESQAYPGRFCDSQAANEPEPLCGA